MKVTINDIICEELNVTKEEILVLGAIQYGTQEIYDKLIAEGYITSINSSLFEIDKKYAITNKGINLFSDVILLSDKDINNKNMNDRILSLVTAMQSIYPEGKNFNGQYWRGNKTDIKKKLQSFFKKYEKYTDEQILQATRLYVQSFNGNYKFMRILKYFIWKDEKKVDSEGKGYIEEVSDLASWIENGGSEVNGNDWTGELV